MLTSLSARQLVGAWSLAACCHRACRTCNTLDTILYSEPPLIKCCRYDLAGGAVVVKTVRSFGDLCLHLLTTCRCVLK